MKLNRSTLRRLIKEELAREVEEAQLDETVGGYGSPEGRAEAELAPYQAETGEKLWATQ